MKSITGEKSPKESTQKAKRACYPIGIFKPKKRALIHCK